MCACVCLKMERIDWRHNFVGWSQTVCTTIAFSLTVKYINAVFLHSAPLLFMITLEMTLSFAARIAHVYCQEFKGNVQLIMTLCKLLRQAEILFSAFLFNSIVYYVSQKVPPVS